MEPGILIAIMISCMTAIGASLWVVYQGVQKQKTKEHQENESE